MYKVVRGSCIVVVAFPEVLREVALSYQRFFSEKGLRTILLPVEGFNDVEKALDICKSRRKPSLVILPFSGLYTGNFEKLLKRVRRKIKVVGFGDGPYTVKVMIDPRALGRAIAMYFKGRYVKKDSYFYLAW